MGKRRNKSVILILAALILLLTACSKKENAETVPPEAEAGTFAYAEDDVYIYSAVKYNIQLDEGQYVYLAHAAEDGLYYVLQDRREEVENGFENRVYRLDYDKLAGTDPDLKKEFGCLTESKVNIVDLSKDITPYILLHKFISNMYCINGRLYFLNMEYDSDKNTSDYLVYCMDEAGNTELLCDITKGFYEAENAAQEKLKEPRATYEAFSVQQTEKGLVFLICFKSTRGMTENITFAVSEDNKVVEICDYEIAEDRFEQTDSGIYTLRGSSLKIYDHGEWTKNREPELIGEFDKAAFTGIVKNSLTQNDGMRLCMYNSEGIYELKQNEYSQLLKWTDMGMQNLKLTGILQYGDEHFMATWLALGSGYIIDMTRSELVRGEKEEITVGTLYESEELDRLVRLFSAANGRYEAKIKVYDNVESLNTELIAGKGPDVFPTNMVDIREYAASGIIEDLGKYLDSEGTRLSRDMLFENILDIFTYDEVLVTIPNRFYIYAFEGLKEELGDSEGWTPDELVDRLTDRPDMTIYDYAIDSKDTAYHIANLLFNSMKETFVDWSTYTAYFDSEEFISILEFLKGYQAPVADTTLRPLEMLDEGKALIVSEQIMEIETVMNLCKSGKYRFIGYPTKDGGAAYGVNLGKSFSINSNSSHKEAAWKFIEYTVMSSAYDDEAMGLMIGFPIIISEVWETIEYLPKKYADPEYVADEESVEQLMYMIDHVKYVVNWNEDSVMNIVREEVNTMLASDRTAVDTARIIQERVQLYLDERR